MPQKFSILLIEDDNDDVELLQEAFENNNLEVEMQVIPNGSLAVEFIQTCSSCPDIIIMDYNLPKVHGREVLLELKKATALKNVPVVILTTSSVKEDMEYAYENGADKFLVKPVTLQEMKDTVSIIADLAKKP